jgi:agmatinase
MSYDPSKVGKKGSLFGYPYTTEDADLVIIPVPWDVTVSYGGGTSQSPALILDESTQLDFSLQGITDAWKYPVAMAPIDAEMANVAAMLREDAEGIISALEQDGELSAQDVEEQNEINLNCADMVGQVEKWVSEHLDKGKIVATLGGDHSTPLGLIRALSKRHTEFGILQIDAHMDLRRAYEGFTYSHASIMFNALAEPAVKSITQVGIRDYCEEEEAYIRQSDKKIRVFFDETLHRERADGKRWSEQVQAIVDTLPFNVYISFDIDGLEPSLCPNTGTPVAGGLGFWEAVQLLEAVVKSGRNIIGFDLSETGPTAWDANVAARILFRLCTYTGVARGKVKWG